MPLPRHSRWVFAGVLAVAALPAAPSRSAAGIAVTVEEVNAAGQVVPGGGQPTFFSASTTGTFTVNALPTPSFQAITVTVDRTTGTPNETNTLTSNVALRPLGVLTGDHYLRVTVTDDGYVNSHPNGPATVSDTASTAANVRGGTNTAQVQTQLKTGTLPGPLTDLGTPTSGASITVPGGTTTSSSPGGASAVPEHFGVEQTIFVIAHADPTQEGITTNSTLGGRVVSSVVSSPAAVPAPAGVALALVGLPLLGLRRLLWRKPAAPAS